MKIFRIQNTYTNKFNFSKTSFGSNNYGVNSSKQTAEIEFYEDTYNKEYTPVNYEKLTLVKGKPVVLQSEQMFKQNKSSLRESELFNDNIDSVDFVSKKYDDDDVPLDRNLWLRPYGRVIQNYAPDTFISADILYNCYDAIRIPWLDDLTIKENRELERYKNFVYRTLKEDNNISYTEMKNLFKSSSLIKNGKEELNYNLCNLAIKIYRNSQVWDDTEKALMDEIKIPIYKKVYGDYSAKKYEIVNRCLKAEFSNEEILDFMKKFYPGYLLDLNSIISKEDLAKVNA